MLASRVMADVEMLRELASGIFSIPNTPLSPDRRSVLAKRIGRKAAGLAIIPRAWTPPFIVIEASVFERWRLAYGRSALAIISSVAKFAAIEARKWSDSWDRGITVRSSATEETLSERGSNESVALAADFDHARIGRAILQIYQQFANEGASGAMAVVVQARVAHLALGHISNEQRVSKTINQWMWEYEPADKPGGRFNSQRDNAPDPSKQLSASKQRSSDLTRLFRKIGRWCTELHAGRTHLEWGASAESLWLFQLDFEDDQPEIGVDPTAFLRKGDFTPSTALPNDAAFHIADITARSGWRKIDKVADFVTKQYDRFPALVHITGDQFLAHLAAGRDLTADLEKFAHGRIVCRTDCNALGVAALNLPRTHTVSSLEAIAFIQATIAEFSQSGVTADKLCFILHKFIPAATAAWAVARKDEHIVRVDSLWGLPDGLQFLPHDSFEYDVRRNQQSSERTRYKHAFLQETDTGKWEVVRVARKATRWRSLPLPDLAEVAQRTHEIAQRLGKDLQVMWFCQIPEATGLPRNIPWFSMAPSKHATERTVSPTKKRIVIRSMADLDVAALQAKSQFLLQLDPDDPELFRSAAFLEKVITVAKDKDFPVGLTGSILGHAYYMIEKAGVPVIALNEPTRSRTRQRRVFRKLVRDEIPSKITEGGETVTLAEIAKGEARAALVGKLFEESYELLAADTPQDVTAELADVLEVVRSLANATGIDWNEVTQAADQKRISRGGFERNIVLLETSWPGWLAGSRAASSFTIPLSHLGQVSQQNGAFIVPFPTLLGDGPRPVIRLANGSKLEISMGGGGVRISPAVEPLDAEEQMGFDFE
ncbi:hypothetical protein DBR17_08535 [Sphingomonas sp. HMWF008]|nr:hypothetical protein DBR17_08535 [Sphingomonas sp. HMWF008]